MEEISYEEWQCPKCKRKVSPYSMVTDRCIICDYEESTGKKATIGTLKSWKKMFKLKIDDGICKGFKNEEGLDFFINKAFDEEAGTHCLLVYIPNLPEYNIQHVQQPIGYESEQERDRVYSQNMDEGFVNAFYDALISQIKENKKSQDEARVD